MDYQLSEWIEEVKNSGKLIIVEGLKDKKALNSLGISNVVTLKKPLFQVIEEIAAKHKEVIILTDIDKKGKLLYGKLRSGLQRFGVKVDTKFREFLIKNTKLSHIEGLPTYLNNNSAVKH
ncbi:toprim domain-containing protein [Candidatus Woesearchaeota archaeon]|nr:toprim domain-containing protein [Candidatus Woesearchaeota archaeon]